jgi:hypothetical protein
MRTTPKIASEALRRGRGYLTARGANDDRLRAYVGTLAANAI